MQDEARLNGKVAVVSGGGRGVGRAAAILLARAGAAADTAMQERIRGVSEDQFSQTARFRAYYTDGWLRPPEEPGTLIRWLATPMAADLRGQVVSMDDATIRNRIAADLGVPLFAARENRHQ
jgi:L-alanine-DL-glutamate epimerase-like enolase superfamily enzyme